MGTATVHATGAETPPGRFAHLASGPRGRFFMGGRKPARQPAAASGTPAIGGGAFIIAASATRAPGRVALSSLPPPVIA